MRLDKLLGALGLCTRSESRELFRRGRVTVNGETVRDGAKNVAEDAAVCLDGKPLDTRLTRHVMLCKPSGVLTAAEDPRQKTVMDLLPPVYRALGCMPVGRLDKDTTGILLLTTDGELAHRLNLRITPELTFLMDDSIEYNIHMSQVIRDLHVEYYTSTPDTDEDDLL